MGPDFLIIHDSSTLGDFSMNVTIDHKFSGEKKHHLKYIYIANFRSFVADVQ